MEGWRRRTRPRLAALCSWAGRVESAPAAAAAPPRSSQQQYVATRKESIIKTRTVRKDTSFPLRGSRNLARCSNPFTSRIPEPADPIYCPPCLDLPAHLTSRIPVHAHVRRVFIVLNTLQNAPNTLHFLSLQLPSLRQWHALHTASWPALPRSATVR